MNNRLSVILLLAYFCCNQVSNQLNFIRSAANYNITGNSLLQCKLTGALRKNIRYGSSPYILRHTIIFEKQYLLKIST